MRIPVVPLLHFVSVLSLTGMGWTGYSVLTSSVDLRSEQKRIAKENRAWKAAALEKNPGHLDWNYRGREIRWWWEQLATANFTGKEEQKSGAPGGGEVIPPVVPKAVDLNEVIELACIMHAGDDTGAVVRYLGEVEVPERFRVVATPVDTIPAGRRRPGRAPAPTAMVPPVQHLQLGQALWAPHHYAVLTHVAADASSVTFEIRLDAEKDEKGRYRQQTIRKSRLVASAFHSEPPSPDPDRESGSPTRSVRGGSKEWRDLPPPAIRKGRYQITTEHVEYLHDKATEHVAARGYDGPGSNGIEVRHLSSHAKKFGVQNGDVVLSVNGVPVRNLAAAKKVGTKLYEKGVRNFRVLVMRRGREMELVYSLE